MGDREEIDVTDAQRWQDSRIDDPSPNLGPGGGLEGGPSRRMATTHPLKLEIPPNSHSPPIWEIVGPPEDNNTPHRTDEEIFATQYVPCLPL